MDGNSSNKKKSFYDILSAIPLSGLRSSERFFSWVSYCFSITSDTPLESNVEALISGDKGEITESGFLDAFRQLGEDMQKTPFSDLLGDYHMELNSNRDRQANGQFYTPESICDLMTRMTISEDEIKRLKPWETISIQEPCCGSGRNILSAAKMFGDSRFHIRAICTDIDMRACQVCFINLTLWGIPAIVIHGNPLTQQEWGRWANLPYITFEERRKNVLHGYKSLDIMRRIIHGDQEDKPAYYRTR